MYTPDKWVLLKIKDNNETIYKVLAGWSGSYLDGQSWKINSGIVSIEEDGSYYLFKGHSGSVYKCHKQGYGTNMIMESILSQISGSEFSSKIQILPEQNFLNLLKE